jgi:hypothetical protein
MHGSESIVVLINIWHLRTALFWALQPRISKRFIIELVRNNHKNPTKSYLTSRAASWGPSRLQVPRRSFPQVHFFSEQSHILFKIAILMGGSIPMQTPPLPALCCVFLYTYAVGFSYMEKDSPMVVVSPHGREKSLASYTCNACGARFDWCTLRGLFFWHGVRLHVSTEIWFQ